MTIRKGLKYLVKPFYENRVYRVYCFELDGWEAPKSRLNHYHYKFIGPEDDDLINQMEAMEEWLSQKIKSKLYNDHICLVALHKKEVAGFNIVALNKVHMPLINQIRELAPDEAWSDQITVSKRYRRTGLGSELRFRILAELKKRNIRKFFGGALVSNKASLSLACSVGFKEIEDIRYIKIMGFKKWKVSGGI